MRIRIFGHYIHSSIVILAVVETLLLFGTMYGAALLRFPVELARLEVEHGPLWPRALLFTVSMIISLLAFGLFRSRQRAQPAGVVVRLVASAVVGFTLTCVGFYVLPNLWLDRGVLMIAAAGACSVLALSRTAFAFIVHENLFRRRVLVYGTGNSAMAIARLRRRSDRWGFTLVGFVRAEDGPSVVTENLMLEVPGGLRELCRVHDVDEVVVAMDDRRRAFPILELLECRLAGVDVTELLTFLERETGRVRIDVLNPSWMIFGEGFRRDTARLVTARMLDFVASSIILLLTLPFMLLTALAIKLEDGLSAPVFYAQPRVGLGGRIFNVLKFRSMRTDAEKHGAQWASKGDTRVTKVGAFIRKCRIDELPQILCVFRGYMSFVGPRPERPQFVTELSEKIPYYVQRHSVKPGITGWAQLCYPYGSSEQDALEKLQYDLYYIKNNTLLFDLAILLQTVEVVVMGQGAR
jgi:sugar transferase (PEP-CTERM system associated)